MPDLEDVQFAVIAQPVVPRHQHPLGSVQSSFRFVIRACPGIRTGQSSKWTPPSLLVPNFTIG